MSTQTTLHQNCAAYWNASGATRFKIESTVTYVKPGDLPSASIFVYSLGTADDPKTDTFLRVGTVQDITELPLGRERAIREGSTTYLSTGFFIEYSDVATAVTAKQLIQSRVDQLISDWITYTTQFVVPDNIYFPLYDASLVASLRTAYKDAKAARVAADAAALTAAGTLTDAEAALAAAEEKRLLLENLYKECQQVLATVTGLVAAETAFRGSSTAFLSQVTSLTTTASDVTALKTYATGTYTPAVAQEQSALQLPLAALLSTLSAMCSAKKSAADTAAADEARANADLAAAKREVILRTAEAQQAGRAEAAALNDLTSACPTIDLASL